MWKPKFKNLVYAIIQVCGDGESWTHIWKVPLKYFSKLSPIC